MPMNPSAHRDVIQGLQNRFETHLQQFFIQNQERYSYSELFEPLYLDAVEFVSRKAKRIRPALFLNAASLFGRERFIETSNTLLDAAIALELLHSFILIHDDVIDRSERRRGLPTFHKLIESRLENFPERDRIGKNIAIVIGDLFFAMASETFLNTVSKLKISHEVVQRFLSYVTDTGFGEVEDILLGIRDISRVEIKDIERMYHYKTTRYTIEAPLVLGAMLASVNEEVVEMLELYAEPIGLAFQIQNDLMEFKHFDLSDALFQDDLFEGKKTLLVRLAFEALNETDRSFLQLCLNSLSLGEPLVYKVRELIQKSGAEEKMRKRVQELFEQGNQMLIHSCLNEEQKEGLIRITQFIQQQTNHNLA